MISAPELLNTSLAQIRTLERFLSEQLDERKERAPPATPETDACHELLARIQGLLARSAQPTALNSSCPDHSSIPRDDTATMATEGNAHD
jgi:hypothetical protein